MISQPKTSGRRVKQQLKSQREFRASGAGHSISVSGPHNHLQKWRLGGPISESLEGVEALGYCGEVGFKYGGSGSGKGCGI